MAFFRMSFHFFSSFRACFWRVTDFVFFSFRLVLFSSFCLALFRGEKTKKRNCTNRSPLTYDKCRFPMHRLQNVKFINHLTDYHTEERVRLHEARL